jgi:hypothetical protein
MRNEEIKSMNVLLRIGIYGSCLVSLSAHAGDAVAVGYSPEGMWTAVTYYSSSTPKGGADYKNSADARQAALQDLRQRRGENMAKAEILGASDLTGYVVVARAETRAGKDVIVVGYGKSKTEAEKKAVDDLKQKGAIAKQKIMYSYFSHGADSAAKP